MAVALLALGSNLGDRRAWLEEAIDALAAHPEIRLLARSNWQETAAIGGPPNQPAFLNGAVTIETALSPEALLASIDQIEQQLARKRHERWGPRTIDLDLLLYDELVCQSPRLVLPHPRMAFRRFVLEPACEIAADWRHPTIGWTLGELLTHLDQALPYLAIAAAPGADAWPLVERLEVEFSAWSVCAPERGVALASESDQSGRTFKQQIELLDRRAADLEQAPWNKGLWIVTPYWLGQMLAEASVWFDEAAASAFGQFWQARTTGLVRPKLLVWLDDEQTTAADQPLREALLRLVESPGQGPVLKLDGRRRSTACDELVAAIRAMQ